MTEEFNPVKAFGGLVSQGLYPRKCLRCVADGFLFCRFWSDEFRCEVYEKVEMLHRLGLLLARG